METTEGSGQKSSPYRAILIAVVVFLIAIVAQALFVTDGKLTRLASADGGQHGECEDADKRSVGGTQDLISYTFLPGGDTVESICIKSGRNIMFGDGHSDKGDIAADGTYENGCYEVTGINTPTVTVKRLIFNSNTCQGLSHIEVYAAQVSQTPTPTPTVIRTPVPSPTIVPSITPAPSATPVPSPSPSPSSSQNPSPTPSPSPQVSGDQDPGDEGDCCPGPDPESPAEPTVAAAVSEPRVAGATTLETFPVTGGFGLSSLAMTLLIGSPLLLAAVRRKH